MAVHTCLNAGDIQIISCLKMAEKVLCGAWLSGRRTDELYRIYECYVMRDQRTGRCAGEDRGELPIRKVILLGGEYQKEYQGMVGPLVRKCAKEFYVDKFFVGTDGFIPDAGFTCDDLMRVETMKYMEDSANRMIILADSSKFSQKGVVIQTTFSEIDTVCTDAEIPEDALENLKRHNINVEITE